MRQHQNKHQRLPAPGSAPDGERATPAARPGRPQEGRGAAETAFPPSADDLGRIVVLGYN